MGEQVEVFDALIFSDTSFPYLKHLRPLLKEELSAAMKVHGELEYFLSRKFDANGVEGWPKKQYPLDFVHLKGKITVGRTYAKIAELNFTDYEWKEFQPGVWGGVLKDEKNRI